MMMNKLMMMDDTHAMMKMVRTRTRWMMMIHTHTLHTTAATHTAPLRCYRLPYAHAARGTHAAAHAYARILPHILPHAHCPHTAAASVSCLPRLPAFTRTLHAHAARAHTFTLRCTLPHHYATLPLLHMHAHALPP